MSNILVIDVGNSRMKWGLHGPHGWIGARRHAEQRHRHARAARLAQPAAAVARRRRQRRRRGGARARRGAAHALAARSGMADGERSACGVTNNYARPSQLGADRWASLDRRVAAVERHRSLSARMRRRQRGNGGDHRRARCRRRVPRRADPAGHAPHAAGARGEHRRARSRRRASSANFRTTPPTRCIPARCRRSAARSSRCAGRSTPTLRRCASISRAARRRRSRRSSIRRWRSSTTRARRRARAGRRHDAAFNIRADAHSSSSFSAARESGARGGICGSTARAAAKACA